MMLALIGLSPLISPHTIVPSIQRSLIFESYCALWHRPYKTTLKQEEAVRAVKEAGLLQGR